MGLYGSHFTVVTVQVGQISACLETNKATAGISKYMYFQMTPFSQFYFFDHHFQEVHHVIQEMQNMWSNMAATVV
jgi:hypothetical protein